MKNEKANSHLDIVIKKNNLSMSKRSQAHVEIVISFVLFAGAVLFIFLFLNPLSQPKLKDSVTDEVKNIIIQTMSSDVGKLSIITKNAGTGECYNFNLSDYPNNNYIEIKDDAVNSPRKYTILFSEIFDSSYSTKKDDTCSPENYTLGSYSEEKIINYKKINETKTSYENDYDNLKKSLGINYDFSFAFRNFDGTEISELSVSKKMPSGASRNAEDIPVRVMDKSGNIDELALNIMAW